MNAMLRKPRGLLAAPRADMTPQAVLAEIQKIHAAFKDENDARLKGIEKKFDDVVQNEKVDRINAAISEQQKLLDILNAQMASAATGAGSAVIADPARREHAQAFSRFFRSGIDAGLRDLQVRAGLTTQSDPDGGYVVTEEIEAEMDRVASTLSIMRQICNVVQSSAARWSKNTNQGGTGSGWVGEEETRPETVTPNIKELEIASMEMYAYPFATQIMLDDGAFDVAAWLADEVGITFYEQEGLAFISGSGAKRPRGITTYTTVANASYTWGNLGYIASGASGAFASSAPADALVDLFYALRPGYRNNAAWLMSDATMGSVRKMKDGQGNYLWTPPSAVQTVAQIMGRPCYIDENMPVMAANSISIALADWKRAYTIVDRMGVRVLRNPFAVMGKVGFYTTKRVGGGISNFEAVKVMKFAAS